MNLDVFMMLYQAGSNLSHKTGFFQIKITGAYFNFSVSVSLTQTVLMLQKSCSVGKDRASGWRI